MSTRLSKERGAICDVCGISLRRGTDLPRHMLTHSKDKQSMMYACPVPSCGHRTLQKSNLATHIRTHTRSKPHKCPEYNSDGLECDFSTADPSSLHRHRKRKHGYQPDSQLPVKRRKKTRVVDGCDEEVAVAAGPSKPRRALRVQAEKENENETGEDGDGDEPGEVVLVDPTAMSVNAETDFDLDEDGEGEPEDETEAVPLFMMPPHFDSAPHHPYLALSDSLPVAVLANISDTRTDVDGRAQ